jgi:hypothetical protein
LVYPKDSWKRIVANIITTVNSLTDEIIDDILSVIFCIYRWIYRHTNKNFDDITYGFLVYDMLSLPMDIPTEEAHNFFRAFCLSINISVYLLLTDSLTNHKLPTRIFPMNYFCL